MNSVVTRKDRRIIKVFIAVALAAALAVLSNYLYFSNIEWLYRTQRMNKKLAEKEVNAGRLLDKTENYLAKGNAPNFGSLNEIYGSQHDEGLILLLYTDGRISWWSGNGVSFPEFFYEGFKEHDSLFISNSWFIPLHRKFLNHDLVALVTAYRQYPISNDFLKSGFPEEFRLPAGTQITFDQAASPFRISGAEGTFHFGLIFPEQKSNTFFLIIPVLLWTLLFILLIFFTVILTDRIGEKTGKAAGLLTGIAALLLIYMIILFAGLPGSVGALNLFSSHYYSAGRLFPSLGHLLVFSVLLLSFLSLTFRSYPVRRANTESGYQGLILPGLLAMLAYGAFLLTEAYFRDLVTRSAINFEAYKILDINLLSIAGFLTVVTFLAVPVMLFIRVFRISAFLSWQRQILLLAPGVILLAVACLSGTHCSFMGVIYIFLLSFTVLVWIRKSLSLMTMASVYAAITAVFSTSLVLKYSGLKEDENLKVLAVTLANDNDPVAEALLIDLWPSLKSDTVMKEMMKKDYFTPGEISSVYRYLQTRYFSGYWENYDLNIVICRDDSPLQIPEQETYASNCFVYFNERIIAEGDSITGTGFWFMHNQAGRAYYLSRLFYDYSELNTNGLFIELISHIEAYVEGYPELLLDLSHQRFPRLKDISFAKYSDTTLVQRSGAFPYDNRVFPVEYKGGEYQVSVKDGFKHLFYNRGDMTLVITATTDSTLDVIITFAYLFVIVLVFSLLLLFFLFTGSTELLRFDTFRRRLQLAFSGLLVLVLGLIIAGALYLSIAQYRTNHTRMLREKISSVTIEFEHKLGTESALTDRWSTPDYYSLNDLLVKFSNVFMTDINLYTTGGSLLATSRPEIFTRNLEGTRLDPVAFNILSGEGRTEFIGNEKIGKLHYLSAYVPFYNEEGKLLAYINIPYFAMQNILRGEISNLLVTLINFTLLLLMLMTWLSVILSERITSPLILLQKAMASVEYGRKNEHIIYNSRDEVGELVKQYNRMIDELEESASRLARSERELAWREMARQIAHEIKNPLTPMKLNVQQLLKWWRDKVPDFEAKLETFTGNQIEYIDNLSSIAGAFSYFARLPGAEPAEVDVLAQLKSSLAMFGNSGDAEINLNTGNITKAVIMADREQLNGIFSNLLKNAIQAIPTVRKGIIDIDVSATFDKILIAFRDNGTGIPEALIPRMFTPNFTTKSSGMGLGLSIVKRYVETAGGRVWFETNPNIGTVFYVELPLLYTVERHQT